MLGFGKKMSVGPVLAVFTQTLADLAEVEKNNLEAHAGHQETIRQATDDAAAAEAEAKKAAAVRVKLAAIIEA